MRSSPTVSALIGPIQIDPRSFASYDEYIHGLQGLAIELGHIFDKITDYPEALTDIIDIYLACDPERLYNVFNSVLLEDWSYYSTRLDELKSDIVNSAECKVTAFKDNIQLGGKIFIMLPQKYYSDFDSIDAELIRVIERYQQFFFWVVRED